MRNMPKLRFKKFTDEWEEKKLGDITSNISSGKTLTKLETGKFNLYGSTGKIGFTNVADYFGENILIARVGANAGTLNFINEECGITDNTLITSVKNNSYYNKWLYYYLINYNLNRLIFGSGQPLITGSLLKKISLSIPYFEEQQKIADFLSSIDKKISITEEKLNLFNEYKKGLMKKIFNQELRFKDSKGNDYPKWEEKRLGEIGEVITGKTPSTKDEKNWNGEIQFVTPTDMKGKKYQLTTERTVSEEFNIKILPKGTVMFTCIGATIGKMSISTKNCITNQQINSVLLNKNITNEYIYYFLLKEVPKIQASKSTTTMPIINKTEFSKLIVELPCLEEQQKIADFLSSIDTKIEKISDELENLKEFKKGLLQQMFV